jgi:hypothetical protein
MSIYQNGRMDLCLFTYFIKKEIHMFTGIALVFLAVGIAATPGFIKEANKQDTVPSVTVEQVVTDKDTGELGW